MMGRVLSIPEIKFRAGALFRSEARPMLTPASRDLRDRLGRATPVIVLTEYPTAGALRRLPRIPLIMESGSALYAGWLWQPLQAATISNVVFPFVGRAMPSRVIATAICKPMPAFHVTTSLVRATRCPVIDSGQ
jgi:hypothetical protein